METVNLQWYSILAISAAIVFSYTYVRRTWWAKEESTEAAQWYSEQRGWELRKSDVDDSARFVRDSARLYGWLALASWAAVYYLAVR
jgi:hypothetical protein